MMLRCEHPEAFLLAIPVLLLLRGRLGRRPAIIVLRALLLILVLAMLARPYRPGAESGRDLVLLLDRSFSMGEDSGAAMREIGGIVRGLRQPGDRVGVVTFGRGATLEQPLAEDFAGVSFDRPVHRQASDVAAGLEAALALVPPGRQGSIVLLSDGLSTGRDPTPVAREAARRGLRIDCVPLRRPVGSDVAVEDVALPGEVNVNEPFQWTAWVRADRAVDATVRILRDGVPYATTKRALSAGANRLQFRERLAAPGVHRFEVVVETPGDPVPENNRALGVVRVAGKARVLCVTPQGREDRLTRTLRAAAIEVVACAPEVAPLDGPSLDGFRAVVLENVPAGRLPSGGMRNLRSWVEDFGGGLLMTGGRASFGTGGYRRSDIEKILPVSLEVRQEQRKFALAMAIALDRSGSMAVQVPGGRTKMDLADLGACAAVELLGPIDSVSVIAVDSSPHIVIDNQAVDDVAEICAHIRRIESEGGGIFIGEALHAAANQLASVKQHNRHVVLFADAADSEEPTDYATFVPALAQSGVTVSVIGMGTEKDSDAALLKRIAELGGGRCFFCSDPADLPRVFAEETIQVARAAIVEGQVGGELLPGLRALGDFSAGGFAILDGYSIAYLKSGAQLGVVSRDELKAPLLSFQQIGLGRSAAFLGEVDGELSGGLGQWAQCGDFFTTIVRWLTGNDAAGEVWADFVREGHQGVLRVEVPVGQEARLASIQARVADPDGHVSAVPLVRTGERRLEARVPLLNEGVWRAVVEAGAGQFVRVPPIALPYSPEYQPVVDASAGERLLVRIAEAAGGSVAPPVNELFRGDRESLGVTDWTARAAWAALVLLLIEIAVRRLDLTVPIPPLGRWLALVRRSLRRRAPRSSSAVSSQPPPPEAAPAPPPPSPPPVRSSSAGLGEALERARRNAQRRQ